MPTLPALLALVLSAQQQRPPSALDGCEATPVENGWQYDCADARARLEDLPEVGDAAVKSLAARVAGARAVVGEGSRSRVEKRLLGVGQVDVVITERPGSPVANFVAGFPFAAGTRVLICSGGDRRCARVLSGLSGMPWRSANARGSIRKDPAPLALAGRVVPVPAGCQATTEPRGGRVVCAKTDWVGWVSTDEATARQMRTTFGETMRKTLDRPGWKNAEAEVPCKVARVETRCVRVLAESGDDRLVVQWAVAPAGQDFTFASCMARGAKIGSPCSLVFE